MRSARWINVLPAVLIFATVESALVSGQSAVTNRNRTGSADKNLPWQPGLGRPLELPKSGSQPARADVIAAQPLPTATRRDPVALTQGQESGVVQATFLQEAGSPVGPAQLPSGTSMPNELTRVTRGMDVLPNTAGQVWRTYDISPYTYAVTSTNYPQQAIVDWILNETGTDVWFSEPLGVLNSSKDSLHVYHTPAMHARIKSIVDRFVQSRGGTHVVGLRLVTVSSPNWRSTSYTMMDAIDVQAPGVEAWLVSKENAAQLANQLRNRADYQEHSVGDLVIHSGQKYSLARTRPVNFVRSLARINDGVIRYQPMTDRIDEGYALEFSALNGIDGRSVEAVIRCDIDQIEKMQRVGVDLPTSNGQLQTVDLRIPQMVSWRFHERFRWPSDQVLLLSCGVVATPGPQREALLGIPAMLNGSLGRADALLFIEYKGPSQHTAAPNTVPGVGQMVPINQRR